ncbi:hypothetical protein BGZ81_008379 [Podila clonocystis]|nr:hypothetical protein BGZ81_008379 [Podila clonocystis]
MAVPAYTLLCEVSDGRHGVCYDISICTGNPIPGFVPSYCPGQSNFQCFPGYCSGSGDIQCCVLPKIPPCKVSDGRTGHCIPTSSCHGDSVPGYCSGASNIQCCVAPHPNHPPPPPGRNLPGLNALQSRYARTIARLAHDYRVGQHGCIVAIATALVESEITVKCNPNVPGSCDMPHDGEGTDHLSVGIFQQALRRIRGWANMPIGTAAQHVQHSAYPDRYANRVNEAERICHRAY